MVNNLLLLKTDFNDVYIERYDFYVVKRTNLVDNFFILCAKSVTLVFIFQLISVVFMVNILKYSLRDVNIMHVIYILKLFITLIVCSVLCIRLNMDRFFLTFDKPFRCTKCSWNCCSCCSIGTRLFQCPAE